LLGKTGKMEIAVKVAASHRRRAQVPVKKLSRHAGSKNMHMPAATAICIFAKIHIHR
jgi:ribosomal protein L18E